MKKVLVILLSVSILGIYGCGNGSETGTSESQVDSTLAPVDSSKDSTLVDTLSNKVEETKAQ